MAKHKVISAPVGCDALLRLYSGGDSQHREYTSSPHYNLVLASHVSDRLLVIVIVKTEGLVAQEATYQECQQLQGGWSSWLEFRVAAQCLYWAGRAGLLALAVLAMDGAYLFLRGDKRAAERE